MDVLYDDIHGIGTDIQKTYITSNSLELNTIYGTDTNFRILHHNIRGINKNFDEFTVLINELNFRLDIIILTETHLRQNVPFNLPGYTTYYFNALHSNSDGILILINTASIKNANVEPEELLPSANAARITFSIDNESFSVIAVYRSPSTNVNSYIKELTYLITTLPAVTHQIYIGDININILKEDEKTNSDYLNMLVSQGYISLINNPTRENTISSSCIDHIFLKTCKKYTILPGILKTAITDHYPILLGWNSTKRSINSKQHKLETEGKINIDKFIAKLEEEDWHSTLSETDVDAAYESFTSVFQKHIDDSTEKQPKRNNSKFKKLKPWITTGLIASIRKRDLLYHQINKLKKRRNHDPIELKNLKEKHKMYRNLLNKLIYKTKLSYYKNKINSSSGCPKKLWATINEITERKNTPSSTVCEISINGTVHKTIDDPKKTADAFVNYFTNVGKNLANDIKINNRHNLNTNQSDKTFNNSMRDSMFLSPVSAPEIMKEITNLKDNAACGYDGFQIKIIKIAKLYIANPLEHIFNLCFSSGVYPQNLKTAIIIPIHKAKVKTEMGNYRPVSVLSHFAKLLERCIKKRLMVFLTENNIVSKNQFGFCPHKSTDDAIYQLTSQVYKSLDEKQKVLAIFLDLAKAFDTVDHTFLIQKLELLGIRGLPLTLFKSYLSERLQMVKIDNIYSSQKCIEYGVPQGTVLGPILFILYINDLCEKDINGRIVTYADDTVLVYTDVSWSEVYKKANMSLKSVYEWLNDNLLTLNKTKTVYLPFSITTKTLPDPLLSIQIHSTDCAVNNCQCYTLNSCDHTKYLGITIDKHIRWTAHINDIVKKARNLLYIFYRLRHSLTTDLLLTVYKSLLQSVLQYGIIGWGGAHFSHINRITVIQKCVLKVILKKNNLFPSDSTFKLSKVLDIHQLYIKTMVMHVFKNFNKFKINNPPKQIGTRSQSIYTVQVPRKNKRIGQCHVDFLGPKIFNDIPSTFRSKTKTNIFKHHLHDWLFLSGREFSKKLLYIAK